MDFFSDEYLMHYGIKGMKWKKRRKPDDLPKDPNDPAYHEIYPATFEEGFNMTPEEKKAMREHNKRAKKLRKKYNKKRNKVWKTTQKVAKRRGLTVRRRGNDKISTVSGSGGLSPMGTVKPRKQIKKREKYRRPGKHPAAHKKPLSGNLYDK